jgi:4-hydroxybenzoate polyprenyltransferase
LIFLISPEKLFSLITPLIFISNLFITAFGYAFNDIEDADDDYHDIKKMKRNPIASKELSKKNSFFFSILLMSTGLILLYYINRTVFFLGIINVLIGFFYSWKPIRLKSKPFMDLISHVLFLGALQFSIIYLALRPLDLHIIPLLTITISVSMMNEIFHEILDYELDKKTQINNTIQNLKRTNIKKILIFLSLIALTSFSVFMISFPLENRLLTLISFILAGIIPTFRVYKRINNL